MWLIAIWLVVRAVRHPGPIRTLRRLLAAAACAGLGVLLGSLLVLHQWFHAFSGQTLVARVSARRLSPTAFELTYTALGAPSRRFRLEGNQWSISGGIVKWHPWLAALTGLPSHHKPIRLSGQFSNIEQHRAHLPTAYPIDPKGDLFWEALYRADPYLPFVEAVYGSSAYVYVEPGVVQEVYVTPVGYLIKRARAAPGF